MKSFRTEVKLNPSPIAININTRIFTIGSCFADAIGQRLQQNKFVVSSNPFGPLYDPLSIHKTLTYIIHNELPLPATYVENQGIWSNYEFHSSLSALDKSEVERKISNAIGAAHHFFHETDMLMLTYGTANVYERKDTGERVANCHKMPGANFSNHLLTPEQVEASFDDLAENLKTWKPDLKIILTVSPVRHIKDTLELNSVSKSILRWSCHRIQERYPAVTYFPSYEMMMDDLRDYRFYTADMIHPTPDGLNYIWEKFSDHYFDAPTQSLLKQWQIVFAALHHRPFHIRSAAHQRFLIETRKKLEELKSLLPVDEEIRLIESQLTSPHDE